MNPSGNNESEKSKSMLPRIIIGTVIVLGLSFLGKQVWFAITHEETDNAQVEMRLAPILSRVSGYVGKIYTDDYAATELRNDPYIQGNCNYKPYAKIPTVAVLQAEVQNGKFGRAFVATKGAFKVPSLRNIELTAPYMHNGSLLTLEQVVDFYFRGGNFVNDAHFAALVLQQPITDQQKSDLVAFLKSLTDERVRWERAPFDHPQLIVPHGHSDNVNPNQPKQAQDLFLTVPAVGKNGRNAEGLEPIKAFDKYLEP